MEERQVRTLPAHLEPLHGLARNLHWGWHPETRHLFQRLDPGLWESSGHNPVRVIAEAPAERLAEVAADPAFVSDVAAADAELRNYLAAEDTWYRTQGREDAQRIAYFSAEFGIVDCLRIFAGGLGVLAGDHLKSASDLGIPLVGVGVLYAEGYFTQHVDADGRQRESFERVDPQRLPIDEGIDAGGEPVRVRVPIDGREVTIRVWQTRVGRVPLYLLDTDVPENEPEDRRITDRLYGGDLEHRLAQEIVLGVGGYRALEALGLSDATLHLNEGHAAFAAVERVRAERESQTLRMSGPPPFRQALARAGRRIVFTTHTPVEAGHDYFPPPLLERYLGGYLWQAGVPWKEFLAAGRRNPADDAEPFCMTVLALHGSGRRNGVSRLHGEVTRRMWRTVWPEVAEDHVPIAHVTNGVHLGTWVAPAMRELFRTHLGANWHLETDPFHWNRISDVPLDRLWAARTTQREALVQLVRERAQQGDPPSPDAGMDPGVLTIVFARRFATYKRAGLLLSDPERLERLLAGPAPMQFVFAGKAHPRDEPGKGLLRQIQLFGRRPGARGRLVFLEGYELGLARTLVQGADVWLNVPVRPYEASGTSGMKAAANGALNLSIADGWWEEAWDSHNRLPAPIGWRLETFEGSPEERDRAEAARLYELLEKEVVPLYYDRDERGIPVRWLERVQSSLRQLPAFFNTHRMLRDYFASSYRAATAASAQPVSSR